MRDYVILTDSCCDLPNKLVKELKVRVLPLKFTVDAKDYRNYSDEREMTNTAFYGLLREEKEAKTVAANPDELGRVFSEILESGSDVLYLAFSSGLSSTYSNGVIAAQSAMEDHPDGKVLVVDTLCASMGEGLLVYYAAKEKEKGKTIDEVAAFVEDKKLNLCHWFTVDDLNHLKRGGRLSPGMALLGSVLGIKPVLHVDDEGHLVNVAKARGRKAALAALLEHLKETAQHPEEQTIFISHGDCKDDAESLAKMVKEAVHPARIEIGFIGPVIGAHSGTGTLAVFFLGSKR